MDGRVVPQDEGIGLFVYLQKTLRDSQALVYDSLIDTATSSSNARLAARSRSGGILRMNL